MGTLHEYFLPQRLVLLGSNIFAYKIQYKHSFIQLHVRMLMCLIDVYVLLLFSSLLPRSSTDVLLCNQKDIIIFCKSNLIYSTFMMNKIHIYFQRTGRLINICILHMFNKENILNPCLFINIFIDLMSFVRVFLNNLNMFWSQCIPAPVDNRKMSVLD